MLKADILKSNDALKDLTEDQIKAIETLSENDENAVIAKKLGEVHGQYDRDFQEATGITKPDGVKTYEWLKSDVLPKLKSATDLESQISSLQTEKKDLEKKLAENSGDETLKKQLADNASLVAQLRNQLTEKENEWKGKLEEAQKEKSSILVENEFARAETGLKYKPETVISKAIRDSYVSSAKQNILSENQTDWIDDGKGGKVMVFKDQNGEILRNPENALKPYTAAELLTARIKDVLDTGKQQSGAGSNPPPGTGGQNTLDLSGAKTQVEADQAARTYLMKKGVERGSEQFDTELTKIRTENEVDKLPVR